MCAVCSMVPKSSAMQFNLHDWSKELGEQWVHFRGRTMHSKKTFTAYCFPFWCGPERTVPLWWMDSQLLLLHWDKGEMTLIKRCEYICPAFWSLPPQIWLLALTLCGRLSGREYFSQFLSLAYTEPQFRTLGWMNCDFVSLSLAFSKYKVTSNSVAEQKPLELPNKCSRVKNSILWGTGSSFSSWESNINLDKCLDETLKL